VEVSTVLSGIVTNREATYVLVFVEDVKRFDGRHVDVKAVGKSSPRSTAEVYNYEARKTPEFGHRDVLLERGYLEILTFVHLQRGKSAVTSIS
jgi:hypothetical protein